MLAPLALTKTRIIGAAAILAEMGPIVAQHQHHHLPPVWAHWLITSTRYLQITTPAPASSGRKSPVKWCPIRTDRPLVHQLCQFFWSLVYR